MMAARWSRAAVAYVVFGCLVTSATTPVAGGPGQPPGYELTGEAGLVRAYDAILDARFDAVDAALEEACGPAPPEACEVLAAAALWWRIQLDPENRALDPVFSEAVEHAIRRTHDWTARDPDNAEAWFYLGGAYGARVQWRVLRGERLAAARDGGRIRQALERAIALEPGFDDAYFGLGMYKYYAAVAPAAARVLRFLLLLPGGNRAEGLEQMRQARARGRLLQGEADYQLHVIDLWYERDVPQALARLHDLRARYPGNPHFPMQIAHVRETYEHDITASLETWRRLLAAAEGRRVNEAALAATRARLETARLLDALHETDRAIAELEAVVAAAPERPYASLALAHLRLGLAHDRLGAREAAVVAYKAALAALPPHDPHDVRGQAAERLRRAPDRAEVEAFGLSLQGWRRFEQRDLAGARAALDRSVVLRPQEPVARYRLARVLQAEEADAEALAQFEQAMRHGRAAPAPILGEVYLEAGRTYERIGQRDGARAAYAAAASLVGAAGETRAAATAALSRLTGDQEIKKSRREHRRTGDQEIRRSGDTAVRTSPDLLILIS
jgi:tetratricopeptide (TPR) repeat protein